MGGLGLIKKSFFYSIDARIPFAVVGIFLLIVSSFTSAVVMSLERNSLESLSSDVSVDSESVNLLLKSFDLRLSQVIDSAGMKAMAEVGSSPVIEMVNPEVNTLGLGLTCKEINKNRILQTILEEVNLFVWACCLNESFRQGDFALNVVVDEQSKVALTNRNQLDIEVIKMILHRPCIPLLGPDPEKEFPVYWRVSVPLTISVVSFSDGSCNEILRKEMTVSATINSRYPLLEALVEEFAWCIDAVEDQDGISQLWSTLTLFCNVYSLARGYLHYSSSKPINVVDNDHLSVLTNAALLLECAQVFGSVDPLAATDFVVEGVDALKRSSSEQISQDEYVEQFNSFEAMSSLFSVFDYVSLSSNPSENQSSISPNFYSELNLSEVAFGILEDVELVKLEFYNESSELYRSVFIDPFDIELFNQIMDEKQSEGFVLIDSSPFVNSVNESTKTIVNSIIDDVYSAGFHSEISRFNQSIEFGGHEGFSVDNGSGEWICMDATPAFPSKIIRLPNKGEVGCGSVVFGLIYDDLSFMRQHVWGNESVDENGNVSWSFVSTSDWLTESVEVIVVLDWFSDAAGSVCDVVDVCYENVSVSDPNLADVIDSYRESFFDSFFWSYVSTFGWSASFGQQTVYGDAGDWVFDEAWDQCISICEELKSLNCSIAEGNCFDSLSLWQQASAHAKSLLENEWDSLLNKPEYVSDSGDFSSAGLKSVFAIKLWFLEELSCRLDEISSVVESGISGSYDVALGNLPSGISLDDFSSVLNADVLSNQLSFPFGLELSLTNDSGFGHSEDILLSVSQSPGFLSTEQSNGSSNLEISNTCLLGPSGFPVLPPYWVVTTNCWLVEVKGRIDSFSLVDCSSESLFDPFFGMRAQQYLRTDAEVYVEDGAGELVLIGYNRPIEFDLMTACFGLVPSFGAMVGDWDASSYPSESNGNVS